MYDARRFHYFFDVLSIGQRPVISFYDLSELSHCVSFYALSELSHSAGSFDILRETGSPAKDSRLLVISLALNCRRRTTSGARYFRRPFY